MKAKTFENLIRKIVREEIDYALRREIKSLKEDLRDELKPTIIEHTEASNIPMSESSNSPNTPVESMPAPVQKVVNRDYRELMQAIDNKKGK